MMLTTVMIKDENGVEKRYVSLEDYKKLNTQLDGLYAKFIRYHDELVEAKREIDELRNKNRDLDAERMSQEKKYKEQIAILKAANADIVGERNELEAENTELKKTVTFLSTELEEVEKSLEITKSRYEMTEKLKINNLSLWKGEKVENLSLLRKKIDDMESDTDTDTELSKYSEEAKRKIDELTKQLEEERAKTAREKRWNAFLTKELRKAWKEYYEPEK